MHIQSQRLSGTNPGKEDETMFSPTRVLGVVALPAAVVAFPRVMPTPLAGSVKIAGAFTMAYVTQEKLAIPDGAGHVLLLTEARGTNRNTGPSDFMSDAEVAIREILDLAQGNGSSQGYVILWQGADSTVVKINGRVTTSMSAQGAPRTSFAGTWTEVRGTGRYAGIEGSGTYKGAFTSPTEFTVDWQGERSK
jgi:hypothetical protein